MRTLPAAVDLPPSTLRVLVLGDSVSGKLGVAMRYRQDEFHAFVAERSVGDCSIMETLTPSSRARHDVSAKPTRGCAVAWQNDVEELKPDVTFVVLGGGYFAKMTVDGKLQNACDSGWHDAYLARITSLIDAFRGSTSHVVVALVPYPGERWRSDGIFDQVDCFDRILSEAAESRSLPTVDLARHICPTRDCILFSDGEPIRPDGLHPDGKGAEDLARFSFREIERAIAFNPAPTTPFDLASQK
jgi:hypothetical protein